MKRINVLHVSADLGIGGSQQWLLDMAANVNKKKYAVKVCYWLGKAELGSDFERAGVEVIDLRQRNNNIITVVIKLIKVIRQNNIQLLHSHLFDADLCAFIAGKTSGVPIIISSIPSFTFLRSRKHQLRYKLYALFFDRFVPISEAIAQYMVRQCNIDPQKVTAVRACLPTGFDQKLNQAAAAQMRKEFSLSENDIVIGTVARLDSRKGYFYLLDAAAIVAQHYPRVKFLCAGGGALKAALKTYARKLGLSSRVIFAGTVRDIPNFLALLDIFTLPSLDEGLGIVILEAMASGLAVVASRVGGIPEIVADNETGFLVKPADADSLAGALMKLIADKELRRKMGREAKARIKDFTPQEVAEKLEKIYDYYIARKIKRRG